MDDMAMGIYGFFFFLFRVFFCKGKERRKFTSGSNGVEYLEWKVRYCVWGERFVRGRNVKCSWKTRSPRGGGFFNFLFFSFTVND